jgi:hypothetical protein
MKTLTEGQIECLREAMLLSWPNAPESANALCDMALEYLKVREDAERYLVATAHYHIQSHDGFDTCKECGLNLRNKIHFTEYIDKRKAAARKEGA